MNSNSAEVSSTPEDAVILNFLELACQDYKNIVKWIFTVRNALAAQTEYLQENEQDIHTICKYLQELGRDMDDKAELMLSGRDTAEVALTTYMNLLEQVVKPMEDTRANIQEYLLRVKDRNDVVLDLLARFPQYDNVSREAVIAYNCQLALLTTNATILETAIKELNDG